MSTGELAYLVMVITAMVVFAGTLAWVSRGSSNEPRKRRSQRDAPSATPARERRTGDISPSLR